MLTDLSPDEYFPVIRQALLDAYKVDLFNMKPPYENADAVDGGIRRLVWGNYPLSAPIFSLDEISGFRILSVESKLGFSHLVFSLSAEHDPPILCTSAFMEAPMTRMDVNRIMKHNDISQEHAAMMYDFYAGLPVANKDDLVTFITHLLRAFIPDYSYETVYTLSFADEEHTIDISNERIAKFNSDRIRELTRRLGECSNAVTDGDHRRAVAAMRSIIDYAEGYESDTPFINLREDVASLNMFICSRMLETVVNPYLVFVQYTRLRLELNEITNTSELHRYPLEIVRKYALLAKNYTYSEYSYLIRGILSYIDGNLSEDLSLSAIADHFGRNPSYLSATFKKETGETITEYVTRQRINAAIQYFNSTNMSVSQVAAAVGIPDASYFSQQFKKHVGMSPSQYKKMLDK